MVFSSIGTTSHKALCLCNMYALQSCRACKDTKWFDLSKPLTKAVKVERHDEIFLRRWRVRHTESETIGCYAESVTFSPRVQLPAQTHTLARLEREKGQNSCRTNPLVNKTYSFQDSHIQTRCTMIHIFTHKAHHNIPNKPYYFQTPRTARTRRNLFDF